MSARTSPPFSKPSSNLRSQQGRIPMPAFEGRKSGADAKEGRVQPMAELRLPIVDRRRLPSGRATNTPTKVRNGGGPKILKTKIEPTMCLKTQSRMTIWPIIDGAICPKMH